MAWTQRVSPLKQCRSVPHASRCCFAGLVNAAAFCYFVAVCAGQVNAATFVVMLLVVVVRSTCTSRGLSHEAELNTTDCVGKEVARGSCSNCCPTVLPLKVFTKICTHEPLTLSMVSLALMFGVIVLLVKVFAMICIKPSSTSHLASPRLEPPLDWESQEKRSRPPLDWESRQKEHKGHRAFAPLLALPSFPSAKFLFSSTISDFSSSFFSSVPPSSNSSSCSSSNRVIDLRVAWSRIAAFSSSSDPSGPTSHQAC